MLRGLFLINAHNEGGVLESVTIYLYSRCIDRDLEGIGFLTH